MKFMKTIREAAIAALVGFGLFGMIAGPVSALNVPAQFAPRQFPDQVTHYQRHVINLGTSNNVDGSIPCSFPGTGTSLVCNVKIGALPYNAAVVRILWQIPTACNTTGTTPACTLSLGTASAGAQFINAQSIAATTTGMVAPTTVAANIGIAATGNGITATGADGGFDLWLNITQSVASGSVTLATTGTIVLVMEYIAANDGGCINVPMAATSPAC